jgi:hypothetical protein
MSNAATVAELIARFRDPAIQVEQSTLVEVVQEIELGRSSRIDGLPFTKGNALPRIEELGYFVPETLNYDKMTRLNMRNAHEMAYINAIGYYVEMAATAYDRMLEDGIPETRRIQDFKLLGAVLKAADRVGRLRMDYFSLYLAPEDGPAVAREIVAIAQDRQTAAMAASPDVREALRATSAALIKQQAKQAAARQAERTAQRGSQPQSKGAGAGVKR